MKAALSILMGFVCAFVLSAPLRGQENAGTPPEETTADEPAEEIVVTGEAVAKDAGEGNTWVVLANGNRKRSVVLVVDERRESFLAKELEDNSLFGMPPPMKVEDAIWRQCREAHYPGDAVRSRGRVSPNVLQVAASRLKWVSQGQVIRGEEVVFGLFSCTGKRLKGVAAVALVWNLTAQETERLENLERGFRSDLVKFALDYNMPRPSPEGLADMFAEGDNAAKQFVRNWVRQ